MEGASHSVRNLAGVVSLFAGVFFLALSPLLLSSPGGNVGIFLLCAFLLVISATVHSGVLWRVVSLIAMIVSIWLALADYRAGAAFNRKV